MAVTPPVVLTGQPVLMLAGKPGIFYLGGEFCPYCAAQRWVIITSMSRFGTFANIGNMQSSSSDVFANTPTFTFSKATFQSPYVTFQPVEHYSNVPDPSTGYYKILTPFTKEQAALVKKFSTAQFSSAATGIPFQDVGNKALFAGPSYSPGALSGLTRNEIAANLSDPTNPTTQAILSASNYMSATVCAIDGQQPSAGLHVQGRHRGGQRPQTLPVAAAPRWPRTTSSPRPSGGWWPRSSCRSSASASRPT